MITFFKRDRKTPQELDIKSICFVMDDSDVPRATYGLQHRRRILILLDQAIKEHSICKIGDGIYYRAYSTGEITRHCNGAMAISKIIRGKAKNADGLIDDVRTENFAEDAYMTVASDVAKAVVLYRSLQKVGRTKDTNIIRFPTERVGK